MTRWSDADYAAHVRKMQGTPLPPGPSEKALEGRAALYEAILSRWPEGLVFNHVVSDYGCTVILDMAWPAKQLAVCIDQWRLWNVRLYRPLLTDWTVINLTESALGTQQAQKMAVQEIGRAQEETHGCRQ